MLMITTVDIVYSICLTFPHSRFQRILLWTVTAVKVQVTKRAFLAQCLYYSVDTFDRNPFLLFFVQTFTNLWEVEYRGVINEENAGIQELLICTNRNTNEITSKM